MSGYRFHNSSQLYDYITESELSTGPFPISNGNRTACRPIRSAIIRVKHEYEYKPNWMTRNPIIN